MIKRTIECDICGKSQTETCANEGWAGWGQIQGFTLNGSDNPYLCPQHLSDVADFVDRLAEKYGLD